MAYNEVDFSFTYFTSKIVCDTIKLPSYLMMFYTGNFKYWAYRLAFYVRLTTV